jgi:NADH:ubiquinone oxidoreductase subunit 4 (subunit M)
VALVQQDMKKLIAYPLSRAWIRDSTFVVYEILRRTGSVQGAAMGGRGEVQMVSHGLIPGPVPVRGRAV